MTSSSHLQPAGLARPRPSQLQVEFSHSRVSRARVLLDRDDVNGADVRVGGE